MGMKRSIVLSTLILCLYIIACSKDSPQKSEPVKPKSEFELFVDSFKAFQAAVARGNINEIAEYINFPLIEPYAEDTTILYTQYNEVDWSVEKTYPNTKEGFLAGGYELLFYSKGRKARGLNVEGHNDVIDDKFQKIEKIVLDKEIELEKTNITLVKYKFSKSEDSENEYLLEYNFKNIDKNDPDFGLQNGMLFYFGKVDSTYKLTRIFLGS